MRRGALRATSRSRLVLTLQLVGTAAALLGVFGVLRQAPTSLPFGAASRSFAAAAVTLTFFLAAASAPFCQVRLPGGPLAEWRAALRRAPAIGLSLAPLALLPLWHGPARAVVAIAAFAAYVAGAGQSTLKARRSSRGHPFGPWEVALLGFCVFITVVYVQIGLRARGNFQNDSAYYYGVARHIVLSGRFEEPIVWHFLRIPPHVPTAPFDYWGGLTSMVLVPVLWLFGPSQHVANTVMACISAASVLVFWYLVAVRRLVRSPIAGAVLVVAFALAPALADYRFDAESIPLFQLLVLSILVAAGRGRWVLASVLAALAYYARPTGVILALSVWAWALFESRRNGTLRRVAATQLVLAGVTFGYGLVEFGSALGVARQAARLHNQMELYFFQGRPPMHLLHARLDHFYLVTRGGAVLQTLLQIVPGGSVLLLLAIAAGVTPWLAGSRSPSRERAIVWMLGLPLAVVVGFASGGVYVPWRTLHPMIPLVMLAGGLSLDFWLGWIWRRDARRPARAAAALLLLGVTGAATLRTVALYGDRELAPLRSAETALQTLDPVLGGQTVASNIPWYVIANTSSAAISIPHDGPRAIADAIRKYHVKWVLIAGRPTMMGKSAPIIKEMAKANVTLGQYHLVRDSRARALQLFRVEP